MRRVKQTITAVLLAVSMVTVSFPVGPATVVAEAATQEVVTLNTTELANWTVGKTGNFYAYVNGKRVSNATLDWSSNNPSVATCENGVLTGVGPGTAVITCSKENAIEATCTVTVKGSDIVTLNTTSLTNWTVGKTGSFYAYVNGKRVSNSSMTWSSNNTAVATCEGGVLTAVGPGTAIISCTRANATTATCTVTVKGNDVVTLNTTSLTNWAVGKTGNFYAYVNGKRVANNTMTWSSDNTAVAICEDGVLTGVGPGTAVITCTRPNATTAKCTVTVKGKDIVTLNATSLTNWPVGKSGSFYAYVNGKRVANNTMTWSSSNTAVATCVDGVLTAVGAGTATITCTRANATVASCTVTVKGNDMVTLNVTELTNWEVGKTGSFYTYVNGKRVANNTMIWSSNNPAVATCENGVLTAKGPGTAVISCTRPNATTATCTVTVIAATPAPGKVYLHKDSNVDTINAVTVGAMPCIGEAKILVFYVDFKNGATNWTKSVQEVEDMFFSEVAKYDSTLAYSEKDSLRSFYYRSSYGKVDITGDVYEYQTKYDTSYYDYPKLVLDEVISYYGERINWDDYDGNNDGYIDGVYLIPRNRHVFGGPNFVTIYDETCGNKTISKYCFLDSCDLNTLLHETCHMFGAPDMYASVGVNPSGIETACIMDQGSGDLPGATKYVYGWLDGVQFVDRNQTGTFQLRSYTNYGDALVIYPNGDSTNRNWFFVEYVTGEGNNPEGGNGLRVWKTQMSLDEEKNILGSKEFCYGEPSSPYEYLVTVHPDGIWNYYMSVGESITPYTYPSTSYSDVFYLEGGMKAPKELAFSGIQIDFLGVEDGVAEVKVTIAETPEVTHEINSELMICVSDNSCAFLDNSERILLATVTFDSEIKVTGEAALVSADKQKTIPLSCIMSKNNKSLQLFLEASNLNALDTQAYTIDYPNIATYYGKSIPFEDATEVTLPKLPIPYQRVSENATTEVPYSASDQNTKSFRMNDEKLLTISFDTLLRKLFWIEIDLKNNQAVTEELELPAGFDWGKTMHELAIWTDDEYYYVYCNEFICCYRDKKLIGYLDAFASTQETLMFCGSNHNSFFFGEGSRQYYRMLNNEESILLQPIEVFNCHEGTEAMQEIKVLFSSRGVYGLSEEVYMISISDTLYYVTKDQILQYRFVNQSVVSGVASDSIRAVKMVDDKIYVFDGGGKLMMHVFDSNFNLMESKVLLNGLDEVTCGPLSLEVELTDDVWIVSFKSVSNSNLISYASTFITVFDMEGNIMNYYRYGDSTFLYVCEVIPISKDDLVCVDTYFFFHIAPLFCKGDVE